MLRFLVPCMIACLSLAVSIVSVPAGRLHLQPAASSQQALDCDADARWTLVRECLKGGSADGVAAQCQIAPAIMPACDAIASPLLAGTMRPFEGASAPTLFSRPGLKPPRG